MGYPLVKVWFQVRVLVGLHREPKRSWLSYAGCAASAAGGLPTLHIPTLTTCSLASPPFCTARSKTQRYPMEIKPLSRKLTAPMESYEWPKEVAYRMLGDRTPISQESNLPLQHLSLIAIIGRSRRLSLIIIEYATGTNLLRPSFFMEVQWESTRVTSIQSRHRSRSRSRART